MRLSTPGGPRTWLSMGQFLTGLALVSLSVGQHSYAAGVSGLAGMILAVALWRLNEMGRRLSVAAWLSAAIIGTLQATSWTQLPWFIGLVGIAWVYWYYFSPAKVAIQRAANSIEAPDANSPPMTSLVLLLRNERPMSARVLVQYVQAAWGGEFHSEDTMPEDDSHITGQFVVGNKPSFLVSAPAGMFLVNVFDQPYFDDPKSLADEVGDLRLRHTLSENKGWMSVDLMMPPSDEMERRKAYKPIAKLIAELSGADCQALFCPEINQWLPWNSQLEEKLKDGDPLQLFETEAMVPVLEVPPDDPRMLAATQEARDRWLEFQQAFSQRLDADSEHFGVKAPVTSGENTEYIWIEVQSIQGASIHGRLANEPVELGALQLGSAVSVRVDQIMDWAYTSKGESTGAFGVKVLQSIQAERAAQHTAEPHR